MAGQYLTNKFGIMGHFLVVGIMGIRRFGVLPSLHLPLPNAVLFHEHEHRLPM
jgi:hypothetical protein